MIPIHDLSNVNVQPVKINELGERLHYDTSQPHRHNYFELFLFENGAGTHYIDFEPFQIESYAIHIVAPGQVHQMQRELKTNGYVFLFDISVFERESVVADFLFDHICFDVHEMSPVYHFEKSDAELLLGLAKGMLNTDPENPTYSAFIQSHLNLICMHCAQQLKFENRNKTKDHQTYHDFRRLLRSNFKEQKKVKDYANALAISEKNLNEIVSKKTGLSVSQLIYKHLILESKRLLNQGNSAKEVAYEMCFEDPAHFSKFFKKQTGLSPSEFQKVHQ